MHKAPKDLITPYIQQGQTAWLSMRANQIKLNVLVHRRNICLTVAIVLTTIHDEITYV